MTCLRSLRVLSVCALLSAAGCFPHASTSTSTGAGPQASPTGTQTSPATSKPPAAAPSPHASAASLSTAPVYVIKSSASKPSAQNTPIPLPSVTAYNSVKSVSASGVKRAAPAFVIPSVAPQARSRGTVPIVPTEPHILAIHISTLEIRSGETVNGYVTTSDNVAAVDIHISSWSMPIPKTRDGLFRASGVIPDLPFFLKGNYTLQVIARAPTGATAERDIPISLR